MKKTKTHWFWIFIGLQVTIALLLAGIFCLFQGKFSGISAILGASIAIIPGFLFAPLFFSRSASSNPRSVLGGFYLAEMLKLCLIILLFTLAFQWSKLTIFPFFAGFITMQLIVWLIPLFAG
jgi:ATP synthase protein I